MSRPLRFLPEAENDTENSAALIRDVIDGFILAYDIEFLGDLNRDTVLDAADRMTFVTNAQTDMSGMTIEQTLRLGDLGGDCDNDIDDDVLFRSAYTLAHPQSGAFEAMVATMVIHEPGALCFLAAGAIAIAGRRSLTGRSGDPLI